MGPTREDVEEFFKHHPPKDDSVVELHQGARDGFSSLALWVMDNISPCPERTHVIYFLREGMFWVNAAIALHENNR